LDFDIGSYYNCYYYYCCYTTAFKFVPSEGSFDSFQSLDFEKQARLVRIMLFKEPVDLKKTNITTSKPFVFTCNFRKDSESHFYLWIVIHNHWFNFED
jgi:hypothetical protein